ncbi:MAG: hypothetical protein ACTSWX_08970 [Promethearchaeota archaeon]
MFHTKSLLFLDIKGFFCFLPVFCLALSSIKPSKNRNIQSKCVFLYIGDKNHGNHRLPISDP